MGIKILLAALTAANFSSWLFVIIATAITDWSKSHLREYGIWNVCDLSIDPKSCYKWDLTQNSSLKDCEGALTATRAFSVMSIIFTTFCMCISAALMAKPTIISKATVLLNLCMVVITNLWLFLGWIMYLGVEARGHCNFVDYGAHLGSSWFLQIFAWIIGILSVFLALLVFMKWKKAPRFAGQPPYVPGPAPAVPYGPTSSTYPQYDKAPPAAQVPYYPGTAPYSGTGPTPNTSPYVPTPYW
jgi:hypothetical protein